MAPHSPATHQIDTLLWVGIVVGAILVLAVNAGLLYVLRRARAGRDDAAPRQLTGSRGIRLRVAGVLTALAAAVFVLGIIFTNRANQTPSTGPAGLAAAKSAPLTIRVTGQQWLWRFAYPNGAFSYYKLVVPVDTAVKLELVSTDVIHTWNVPDLTGKRDAVPGKTHDVTFRADQEGTYYGDAATLSGANYGAMRTAVEVVSPQAYEEFIKQQKQEIEAAQRRVIGLIENGEVP